MRARLKRLGVQGFALCLLLMGQNSVWATATLVGVVQQQDIAGPPLGGVQISAPGANQTVSTDGGQFTLKFPDLIPGSDVNLMVAKAGWGVVNHVDLDARLPVNSDAQVMAIFLAPNEQLDSARVRYYQTQSLAVLAQQYQLQLAGFMEKNKASVQQINALHEKYRAAQAQVTEMARRLADYEFSSGNRGYEQALRLFVNGDLDGAFALLDETALDQERSHQQQQQTALVKQYILRGDVLAAKLAFSDALKAYRHATEVDAGAYDAWFSLAYLAQQQHRLSEASTAYQQALMIARRQEHPARIALTLNNLGVLQNDEQQHRQARATFNEALKLFRQLAANNPARYRADVATTQNNLGNLHRNDNKLLRARMAYEEALQIRRELAAATPDVYRADVAATLNNLGVLSRTENRPQDARAAYTEALQLYQQLAMSKPLEYQVNVAATQYNLCILELHIDAVAAAQTCFTNTAQLYSQLNVQYPDRYTQKINDIHQVLRELGR